MFVLKDNAFNKCAVVIVVVVVVHSLPQVTTFMVSHDPPRCGIKWAEAQSTHFRRLYRLGGRVGMHVSFKIILKSFGVLLSP